MTEKNGNFVPVSALDKRVPSRRELLHGLVRQAPFVAKNFRLYFRNEWRRHVLRTKVVAPYAITFYVTHKCNLACSYCTQKEPDVFSEELGTADTIRLLRKIRKESDSIVITGGEPGRAGGGSDQSAVKAGGSAEGDGEPGICERAAGKSAAHHHQHGD